MRSQMSLCAKMEGLGVEFPKPARAETTHAILTALIAHGLRVDVPALEAMGQYLD
jgi:hypothetical protein